MRRERLRSANRVLLVLLLVGGSAPVAAARPLSTAFTYQGQLLQSGLPTNGTCDFQFGLFDVDSGGTASGTQTASPVNVTNGLFTVQLNDSGQLGANIFNGSDRWLEIAVRCPVGSGSSYTTLAPRQQLTAAPYALYAPTAGSANGLSCSGCVSSGSIASGTVQQSNLAFTPGTVTSVTAGSGLSGGTITTSGTISNSGVLSVGAGAPLTSSGGQNPSVSLTGTVPVANGGTGASTAAAARASLGTAASGANADITSLSGITDAHGSTRLGLQALGAGGTGIDNTAVGRNALAANTSAGGNTALGANALGVNTGSNNTAVGHLALSGNTTGSLNTAVGHKALAANPSGSSNIAIGKDAGSNTTTGSNDIYIGNIGTNESDTTRIGTTQTQVFIAGISGATSADSVPVYINGSGQLGTTASHTARFRDNGDGTVTDHQTGLMWEKKTGTVGSIVSCTTTSACSDPRGVNNRYTWSAGGEAANGTAFTNFLERLNGRLCDEDTCTGPGGYTDWRLPTIAELKTIVDLSATGCPIGSPCINPIFGPTPPAYYWSATTVASNPSLAWVVAFGIGVTDYDTKTSGSCLRAVRSGG